MGGEQRGYAAEPRETVNYVSAHDNETLFDGIMLRSAPDVPLAVRCRLNRIAVAVVAFSQGVPFFHAGDEILRSKSLDGIRTTAATGSTGWTTPARRTTLASGSPDATRTAIGTGTSATCSGTCR